MTGGFRVSKRFTAALGFSFAVEGAMYSAVTPILPLLKRDLGLSDFLAGLLLSGYSAGLIVGSLAAVPTLRRISARDVAAGGLVVLAGSTAAFAWAQVAAVSVLARLLQGVAAGVMWTACISWVLSVWPQDRRGEALSTSMAPAVIGTLAGPAIGTAAVQVGTRLPYTVVAALCLAAAVGILRMPRPARMATLSTQVGPAPGTRSAALAGAGVAALAGGVIGLVNLTGPLTFTHLGAADYVSGVVFLIGAVCTVAASRPMGLLVDRFGVRPMTLMGLVGLAVLLFLLGATTGVVVTGVVVVALVVGNTFCYVASGTMVTRGGQHAGWSLGFATALMAMVWGTGETIGALLAGLGLDSIGLVWSTVIAATVVLVAVGVVAVLRTGTPDPRDEPTHRPEPDPLVTLEHRPRGTIA